MRPPVKYSLRLSALALAAVLLNGCVYRMNIQQGNFLDPDAVAKLQLGMTRSQVRYLLGTPMLPDAFDTDRWDYLYYMKRGRLQEPQRQRLTVFFSDDKVAQIDKDRVPEPLFVPKDPAAPALPTSPGSETENPPS